MAGKIAESLESRVKLNDGVMMPLYGVGTSRVEGPEQLVLYGLQHGFRLIDTAVRYGNEEAVGKAITKSGIPREELFVVSKLWADSHGYENCVRSVKSSLSRLSLDYIDLYLIHSPLGGEVVATYDALLDMKAQGLIRSVGVSNFDIKHMEGLKGSGRPLPSVNQFELHPWYQRKELVNWCQDHGVTITSYSPLVKGGMFHDPQLLQLAEKYNKTPAQMLVRWSVQQGYITIPKSSRTQRLMENSAVFDWTLKKEDLEAMRDWDSQLICAWNPCAAPWQG